MDVLLQTVKQIVEWVVPNLKVEDACMEHLIEDVDEPFLLGPRTDNELADYDAGFQAGEDGKEPDDTETLAWQRGWAEAQE